MEYELCYGSAPLRHFDFPAPSPCLPQQQQQQQRLVGASFHPMPCSAPASNNWPSVGVGGDSVHNDSCHAATASPCFPMGTPSQPTGDLSLSSDISSQCKDNGAYKVKDEPPDWSLSNSTCSVGTSDSSQPPEPVEESESSQPIKKEPGTKVKQEKLTDSIPQKKKRDRFNGMSEEEVLKKTLPDHLHEGLDIVIIGINPGLTAAYVGHHYAGPGNHFWKCLYLSGLIPEPMNAYDDFKLRDFGIGFTNIVERTSRGSADLTRKEIKEGGEILRGKIQQFKPKIAVFNGKGIYEVFCGHKNFYIGKQPEPFPGTDTAVFVMPSSSARCSQLPRAVDKVPFYIALKKLRDHMRGDLTSLDDSEIVFPDLELKVEPRKDRGEVKTEPKKRDRKRKKTEEPVLFGDMGPQWNPAAPQMTMDGMFGGNPTLVKTEDAQEVNQMFPPGSQVDGAPYYGNFNTWNQMNYYPSQNNAAFTNNIPQQQPPSNTDMNMCNSFPMQPQQQNMYPQNNGYNSSAFANYPSQQQQQYSQQFPQSGNFMPGYAPHPPGGT